MEVNPNQATTPTSSDGPTPQPNGEQKTVLGQLFFRIVQKVMDSATENSNSGA